MAQSPRVVVNVAQSLNGMIAGPNGRRVDISSLEDRRRVMELRSRVDGIIVGANTVINDNPKLTTGADGEKSGQGKQPARIILDGRLRSPLNSNVFDGAARTIVFTSRQDIRVNGAEIIHIPERRLTVANILDSLSDLGISSVLVEGGKNVIHQFIEADVADEFHVYMGDILVQAGGLVLFEPSDDLRNVVRSVEPLGNGVVISLDPHSLSIAWRQKAKAT